MTTPSTAIETRSMATHPLLAGRWSPVIFDRSHEISDNDLSLLLQAAQWAPSASNTQPWAFVVCRRGDQNHEALKPLLARGNASWVPDASVVLIGLAQVGEHEGPGAPPYSRYAEYDAGQAVAHLTLQARAGGMETHQFGGFDHDGTRAAFHIPNHFAVLAGIAVGLRADETMINAADPALRAKEQRARERRPVQLFS